MCVCVCVCYGFPEQITAYFGQLLLHNGFGALVSLTYTMRYGTVQDTSPWELSSQLIRLCWPSVYIK